MSHNPVTLVGSVIERKPSSQSASKGFASEKTPSGFPAAQHRSQSVFARSSQASRNKESTRPHIPTIVHGKNPQASAGPANWREKMSRENEERVAKMTEDEREQEKREIVEHFGVEVEDLMKRVKLAREKQAAKELQSPAGKTPVDTLKEVPITNRERFEKGAEAHRLSPPPPALSTSSTRPSSRADRRLRFANVLPEDIHVYESAPPSPRRKALALPPPTNDGSAISLGQFSVKSKPKISAELPQNVPEPEEGSAEYIRRRYFPDAPQNDPNLSWMEQSSPDVDSSPSSLRFDLTGKPIPAHVSTSLPTHLGLHHHAEGVHAGYSLDDIFLLSRSTVPAQRATMLGVLTGIVKRLSHIMHQGTTDEDTEGMEELRGTEEELRKRILAAGVEAMGERGSIGARAVEVIWQCIVGWDPVFSSLDGIELEKPSDEAMSTLRLDFFLPQVTSLLLQGEISKEVRSRLLGILHRLAQHNHDYAASIVTTPKLLASVLQTFLPSPSAIESSLSPDPLAIEFFIVLAKASRENAAALQEAADTLLRFVTFLPSSSMYSLQLTTTLLTSTLRFYTVLANYGLASHIASTAMEPFAQLAQYILSDSRNSPQLMAAWSNLLASWITCAVDPHQTTPKHGILWSQVTAWGWNSEAAELSRRLGITEADWPVWAGVWKVHVAWLDGARVNGVKGGLTERMETLETIKNGFENGKEKEVVLGCLDAIRRDLSHLRNASTLHIYFSHLRALSNHALTLAAAISLWLSCLPPSLTGPLDSPPFHLPFSQISELCARLTVHSVWSQLASQGARASASYLYLESLSDLLSCFLRLSRRLPGVSDALWAAQALSVLTNLLPGDEDFALQTIDEIFNLLKPEWLASLDIQTPSVVWDNGGMSVIRPFVARTIRPHQDVHITLSNPTPYSISKTTMQRLPSVDALRKYGLPVPKEWALVSIDHMLRFGGSEELPSDWNASEVDVARVSLVLAMSSREILHHFGLTDFTMTQNEVTFGCMKIFMLEHGQEHSNSAEEVFRDHVVGHLMEDLLRPYTIAATSASSTSVPVIPRPIQGDLEQVSTRFLRDTPFYQYYTDFVALYDAISFSHPLFARLLLPPTSMRYPIDYRKYLWNDFGHVLRTVHTPIEEVIGVDIKEYLWPIETDGQMVGFYLRALLKERPQGFVRLVALHHVAANIWADLHDEVEQNDDRAGKLMKTAVSQGGDDLIQEIACYRQTTRGPSLTPPHCFEGLDIEMKTARFECTVRWGIGDRLRGLFLADGD